MSDPVANIEVFNMIHERGGQTEAELATRFPHYSKEQIDAALAECERVGIIMLSGGQWVATV